MERNRDEAGWFMKVAWNLALQCGDSYREMGDLFTACFKVYLPVVMVTIKL